MLPSLGNAVLGILLDTTNLSKQRARGLRGAKLKSSSVRKEHKRKMTLRITGSKKKPLERGKNHFKKGKFLRDSLGMQGLYLRKPLHL
ncbi:hypothetical protein CDAR_497811 [Caerostris darwini]|uniref:50S ribosomal protein L35 n=1 Tax=Caerostris darwini TaxID=1538125 RepID=A0AAV4PR50_9ARAC|nr:hypothetical protein CDAR_497811 [Caerostris darwini]